MAEPVRTLFLGSGPVALPALERLLEGDLARIEAVVTAPPRPAGRKRVLVPTPVAEAASVRGLVVLTPQRLRDEATMAERTVSIVIEVDGARDAAAEVRRMRSALDDLGGGAEGMARVVKQSRDLTQAMKEVGNAFDLRQRQREMATGLDDFFRRVTAGARSAGDIFKNIWREVADYFERVLRQMTSAASLRFAQRWLAPATSRPSSTSPSSCDSICSPRSSPRGLPWRMPGARSASRRGPTVV